MTRNASFGYRGHLLSLCGIDDAEGVIALIRNQQGTGFW
jgi:hypothetical protein